MIILGLDSSAVAASCAVLQDGKVIASGFINTKITHSQTLMPLTESLLKAAGLQLEDVDCFAVSVGPGSFTGLRIAVSAIKGMATALDKPVCGVSTLESLAYNLLGRNAIACPVMDARRGEVYNAIFEVNGDVVTRLTPDRAISLDELGEELAVFEETEVVLVGDGAELAYTHFDGACEIAPEQIRFQNAVSVCLAAINSEKSKFITAKELMPIYIRKPQAEREKEEKENELERKTNL